MEKPSPSSLPRASLDENPIIAAGHFVLQREIEGLHALIAALDDKFVATVDMLYKLKGRVVVSGMGKSGHIAKKIAATFASTGTPSMFVHPGEASHGDLGMIAQDDVVIVLSNSGETAELKDIINYTRRFNIKLIAVVRRKSSALVGSADIAMVLPEIPEASPVGAPTTSTTMMLALGDAIAIALMERKGFSEDDFGVFHPGGKLGKAFIKVDEVMHKGTEMPVVREDILMSETLIEITQKSLGCAGVTNAAGKLIGIITDGDLRRHMQPGITSRKAADVMTRNPVTIGGQSLLGKALSIMEERSITTLFVVDDDHKPIGVLHIHDVLRAGVI